MKKRFVLLIALLFVALYGWTGTLNVPSAYTTIQAAVAAAIAGDMITVENNYNHNGMIVKIDKNLTIEGNGFSINSGFDVISGAVVTVRNLKIDKIPLKGGMSGQSSNPGEQIVNSVLNTGSKLTLDGVTITVERSTSGNTYNLVGVNVGAGAELVLTNSTLNLTNESNVYGVYGQSGGPKISVTNTTLNAQIAPEGISKRYIYMVGSELAKNNTLATINLSGNTYNPTFSNPAEQKFREVYLDGDPSTLTVTQINNYLASVLTNGQTARVSYPVLGEHIFPWPVHNVKLGLYYDAIQSAIDAATAGDVITVDAGTYTEAINVNKALTINGPNVSKAGNDVTRGAEAILLNGTMNVNGSPVVIDGFKVYQTNDVQQDVVMLGGSSEVTFQNSILERKGVAPGIIARAIAISGFTGAKTIQNNLFTGDPSGGFWGGHKTWNSGLWINGGVGNTVNILNNVFENCRGAVNIDDMAAGIDFVGNTFQSCGTYMSFGGTNPSDGSFTFGSNNFKTAADFINLSNVASTFKLDISSGTYNGTAFSDLPLADLFTLDSKMYHRETSSGKFGLVYYVANHIYVNNKPIQTAINYAKTGDVIEVAAGTFEITAPITINKGIQLRGVSYNTAGTASVRTSETILNDARTPATNFGAFAITTTESVIIDGFTFQGSKIIVSQPANAKLTLNNNRLILAAMPNSGQTNMIFSVGCVLTLNQNYIETTGFNASNSALMQVEGAYKGSGTLDKMVVTNNIFKGIPNFVTYNDGNGQSILQLNFNNCQGNVDNNTFDGVDIGLLLGGTGGNMTISGNTFDNIKRHSTDLPLGWYGAGILLFNPSFSGPVNISSNTFQNSDCGIRTASDGGAFTETGSNLHFSNNTFSGNIYDIVNKMPAVTFTLDGDNKIAGATLSSATTAQLFAVEDKIVHKIDKSTFGFVNFKPNNVYVTANSFFIPGSTTTPSIERGIDAASAGYTVNVVSGTYDGDVNTTGKPVVFSIGNSPACVTINGNVTLTSADTWVVDIKSATACSGTVNGNFNAGGAKLSILVDPDYVPAVKSAYQIFNVTGTITGAFSATTYSFGKYRFSTSFATKAISLVSADPLAIDAALYEVGCAEFKVVLKPSFDLVNDLSNVQFTLKYPDTVELTDVISKFGLTTQTPIAPNGGFKYVTYAVTPLAGAVWSAGTENVVLTFRHNRLGTGVGNFEILPYSTATPTTSYYTEYGGLDVSGAIYANALGASLAGCPVHNETKDIWYYKIQPAITAADATNTITVAAGTYAEDIIVNKALTILGPKVAVSGCDASRGTGEAIIVPATNDANNGVIFNVQASKVTIKGFTIDGDNLGLTGGYAVNGADVNAAKGVQNGTSPMWIDNFIFDNNIVKNIKSQGVYIEGNGTQSSFNYFRNNKFTNIWNEGIQVVNQIHVDIENNCFNLLNRGISSHTIGTAASSGFAPKISNNTIEISPTGNTSKSRGIWVNHHYTGAADYDVSGNTITADAAIANDFVGIAISTIVNNTVVNVRNNTINGNGVGKMGYYLWNTDSHNLIVSGGSVTGVTQDGVLLTNYDAFLGFGANYMAGNFVKVDNVTINSAGNGVHLLFTASGNGAPVSAEVSYCTNITSGTNGIFVDGANAFGNIHNNTINASAFGINVNGSTSTATNALTIKDNAVTFSSQLAGTAPTVGVSLNSIGGTQAALISNNTIAGPYFGYKIYNLNTVPATTITGGFITGIMQGVAAWNLDPVGLVNRAPSAFNVSNLAVSGFAGANTGSFHAGVYVYTGGAVPNTSITATVDKVSVTGTGKFTQDCAGLSFADFSTFASAGQTITVSGNILTGNLNRGINVRGDNAVVNIIGSTLTNNGFDPEGSDGNDGFGVIALKNANVSIQNCLISNPASTTKPVTALSALGGATITAEDNSLVNNGNANGKLANNSSVVPMTATCNWWGTANLSTISSKISGNVNYIPYKSNGTEHSPSAFSNGFDPAAPCEMVLPLKVWLQGPYSAGLMTTNLSAQIPTNQPYNVAPWNYPGAETLPNPLPVNVVDWVMVEARSDANTAVERSAGLLFKDGSVKANFDKLVQSDAYYFVVYHRNHIPVMSADKVSVASVAINPALLDLTVAKNLYGNANLIPNKPAIELTTGVWGMIAGDVTHNGSIQYSGPGNDRGPILARINAGIVGATMNSVLHNGYWFEDVLLDNTVLYNGAGNDRQPIIDNLGILTGTSYLNAVYTTPVPLPVSVGGIQAAPGHRADKPISIEVTEKGIAISSSKLIENALVDNIQFTLAWETGNTFVEKAIKNSTSSFMLLPQGEVVNIDGISNQVFVSTSMIQLPKSWNQDETKSVLSFGNSIVPGSVWIADNDFTATHNAMYYVSVWGEDLTGEIKAKIPTGVNDLGFEGINVYPNPTINGKLFISLSEPSSNDIRISIFDVNGRMLRATETTSVDNLIKLDVSTFVNGVYFLKVVVDERVHTCRFIVRK